MRHGDEATAPKDREDPRKKPLFDVLDEFARPGEVTRSLKNEGSGGEVVLNCSPFAELVGRGRHGVGVAVDGDRVRAILLKPLSGVSFARAHVEHRSDRAMGAKQLRPHLGSPRPDVPAFEVAAEVIGDHLRFGGDEAEERVDHGARRTAAQ